MRLVRPRSIAIPSQRFHNSRCQKPHRRQLTTRETLMRNNEWHNRMRTLTTMLALLGFAVFPMM
jgi:hypothetical protein